MDLPDESQWDETTCKLAVCQHPQCWATIRRVERGHPRILGPPCKTALNNDDKSPVLTIVNISDSCFRAKRLAHGHLSGFTFTKAPSLLCQGSKFDSKFQGRPRKDLPDKDFTRYTDNSPKLSVLNLNETRLPSSQDVRNMVVVWIPEQPEKRARPAEKKRIVSSQDGRMNCVAKDHFLYRRQKTEAQLGPPRMHVPPPLPVHIFEQLTSESIPFWNQFDLEPLPQDLLKNLLPDEGKTRPSLEMKTQLAMMKKKVALEKSRPDSAISAKMFLSVHRLALQRPALRYPEHLKKLCSNLNTEGRFSGAVRSSGHKQQQQQQQQKQQQQQQRLVKTPPKRQEAKKKPKSDPGSPNILHKRSGAMVYGPRHAHRTLLGWKSDQKQPQWMKLEGLTLKQDSTERPQMKNYLDSFPSKDDPELSKTKPSNKDISTQEDAVLESQERSPEDLSDGTSRTRWNPELKLLRILQATDDEDEEN
ncbi:uncharacterized protein C9orf43 homolog isoform X1 [Felis catus]|uniref:uncharacterized protein C9orf43 homolog isoform X1 n=1 Tax=Felis catus TaxID=9685 RepID=UPI0003F19CD5|nr:uncharacterized protein C9orf43 homolog isoform X1 [Felis catus]XP_019671939.1 uncharacterized protein C9orf43 homolog isoform X1 [Felis catus]XP_044899473.1 uncharacterized protein C9orf43 homolog isoform X1 [Felis catus]XP_044899474.1 uncharacterized protein C9orf43 homolog isoform X1 [Felis catus]XP_044899475.1 uncharacterized protein C9orf43 homolog isoform X1 [Felis catus]